MKIRHAAALLFVVFLSFLLAIGVIRVTKEEGLLRAVVTSLAASIPVWFLVAFSAWKRKARANKPGA